MNELGKRISHLRKLRDLRQWELAYNVGISKPYMSQIEDGTRNPSMEILEKIAGALKVPLPILLFLTLTDSDISPDKRELFSKIRPVLMAAVQEIFFPQFDNH
jgi:transcriptional regulator with XRE-family HTH domain